VSWVAVAAVVLCALLPAVLGALARSVRAFRLVLLLGLLPAILYWVEVALVDPSYDLTRVAQLLFPVLPAVALAGIWCGLAYAGRAASEWLAPRRRLPVRRR
jgi:hypothetical protein